MNGFSRAARLPPLNSVHIWAPSLIEHSNTVFQNGDVIEKGKVEEEYQWYHSINSKSVQLPYASKYHEAILGASVH